MTQWSFPDPRTPDPQTAPRLRWGIAGPGSIAETFASALQEGTGQEIAAVGSRSSARSEAFANKFGIPRAHSSYQDLFDDSGVDVVYIATPHTLHADLAHAAVRSGKHVLVEKPIAVDPADVVRLQEAAAERGLFLMEAMWPRFLPSWDTLRQMLESGRLGALHALRADLGEYFTPDPQSRLFDPELAGGALYDLGVYLVALSSFVMGPATDAQAQGSLTETGVDAQVSFTLRHSPGQITDAFTTLYGAGSTQATIFAEHATVQIDAPWYTARRLTLTPHGGSPIVREFEVSSQLDGFAYEIAEAARRIDTGELESPLLPLAESTQIQQVLGELVSQVHGSHLIP